MRRKGRDLERKAATRAAYYEKNKEALCAASRVRQVELRKKKGPAACTAKTLAWRKANPELHRQAKYRQEQRRRLRKGKAPRKHDAHRVGAGSSTPSTPATPPGL